MKKQPCNHSFILSPGNWYGEGRIVLNMVEEELIFSTNWAVQLKDLAGRIPCCQQIQIQGLADAMSNQLTFSDFKGNAFTVEMENPNIGRIVGTGIFDDQSIAWEFRNNDAQFEGYETYLLQPDGSYLMRGEYMTSDQFRTQIEALVWQQSGEVPSSDGTQENEGPEGEEDL
jgi:hypothetical protein